MSVSLTKAFESVPILLCSKLEAIRLLHLEYFSPKATVPEADVSAILNVLEAQKLETVSPASYKGILSEVETLVHGAFFEDVSKGERDVRKMLALVSLRHLLTLLLELVLVVVNILLSIYSFYKGKFLTALMIVVGTLVILYLLKRVHRTTALLASTKLQQLELTVKPRLTSALLRKHLTTVQWSELEIAKLGVELPSRLHALHRALAKVKSSGGAPGRLSVMVPSVITPAGSESLLESAPKHFALFLRIGDVGCCYDIYCNGAPLGPRIALPEEQVAELFYEAREVK